MAVLRSNVMSRKCTTLFNWLHGDLQAVVFEDFANFCDFRRFQNSSESCQMAEKVVKTAQNVVKTSYS